MCQYQTTRSYLYQRHMKVHSAEESKGGPNLFVCSQVGIIFNRLVAICIGSINFVRWQCDYRTSRKMHFLRHVKDVHRQWRPYLCHHCGKAFKRPDALKQHSVLHAAPGAPDSKLAHFQCRPCGKICRSRAHLKGNCYATHCGNKPVRPFIKRIHVGRAPSRPFIGAIFSVRDLRRVF